MAIVSSGLILHVDANDPASYSGSGSTWYDLSPAGRNVTLSGAPAFNAGGWLTFNYSAWADQYGLFSLTGLPTGTAPRTLCAWFRPSTAARRAGNVVLGYGADALLNQFRVGIDNRVGLMQWYGGGVEGTQDPSMTCGEGWFFVAATYDGTTSALYLNNTKHRTRTQALVTDLSQGGICLTGRDGGYGDLARACIYNRCLTDAELYQNYSVDAARFAGSMGTPLSVVVGGSPPADVVLPHATKPTPV